MKITAGRLNAFLQDQEECGTRVAMANLLAAQAYELLRDIGRLDARDVAVRTAALRKQKPRIRKYGR